MTALAITDLTSSTVAGDGIYDLLMKANKAHLQAEYEAGRIRGPEYATVYLGSLEPVLQASLAFLVQKDKVPLEAAILAQQLLLLTQQTANAVLEGEVLVAQKCKLQAEYDLTVNTTLKTTAEIALLSQKAATERAQTLEMGVDANSVVGKQKALYQAQTDGFARDGEQKAAKLLVDTWSARRMSDEGTVADATNMLNDVAIGRAVNKLLAGVGA